MNDYAAMERRLVARLLKYWRGLGGGLGRLPAYSDVDHTSIGEEWDWCFVLDCRQEAREPTFVYVGDCLIADLSDDPIDCLVSDIDSSTLLSKALSRHETALRRKIPVVIGGAFGVSHGQSVLYRGINLPLKGEDGHFGYILGAAGRLIKDGPFHV